MPNSEKKLIILQGKTKPGQEKWGTINAFGGANHKLKPETVRAHAERQMEMWQRCNPNWLLRITEVDRSYFGNRLP